METNEPSEIVNDQLGRALVAEEQASEAAPEPVQVPNPSGMRVVNFMVEVVKPGDKEGAGQGLMNALNRVLGEAMALGFSEEQATRACGLWLMDVVWKTLAQHTSLFGAMLTVAAEKPYVPPIPSTVVPEGAVPEEAAK